MFFQRSFERGHQFPDQFQGLLVVGQTAVPRRLDQRQFLGKGLVHAADGREHAAVVRLQCDVDLCRLALAGRERQWQDGQEKQKNIAFIFHGNLF